MRRNPYKAVIACASNPLLRPLSTFAMSVEDGSWYNQDYEDEFPEVEVLLFETPIRGLESLIGGMYVRQGVIEDDTDRWVVEGSAALTGYGPLLYDIAARVVGAPISPSNAQSDHAERFWSRQAGRRIRNLSDAEFQAKYGVSYIPVRDPGPMRQRFQDAVKQSFGYGIPLDRSVRTMPQSNPYKAVIPIVSGVAYVPNPMLKPTADFAFDSFLADDKFYLMVWDRSKKGLAGLIGGGYFEQSGGGEWQPGGVAAVSGYGPLIYDLTASELNSPVFKSPLKSKYAQDFWAKQDKNYISPMSPGAFKMKYGVTIPRVTPDRAFEMKMSKALGDSYAYSRPLEAVIKKAMRNPKDLAGRHIPERYLAGLPPALQKQRIRELTQSRDAYWKGDYSELPTDRTARKMGLVKQSKYTTEAKKRGIEYRGNFHDMAKRTLEFYSGRAPANEVAAFAEALKKSFAKGLAAWKSGGHRPGATAQNWAVARVNSLVVGGKTSWTADKKQFAVLPDAVREKIESMRMKQNPIKVEVHGKPNAAGGTRLSRFFASKTALDRIEAQAADIAPNIKFIVEWDTEHKWGNRIVKGMPGVITLLTSPKDVEDTQKLVESVAFGVRPAQTSLYTAHTILHRLGDRIMPDTSDFSGTHIHSDVSRAFRKVGYVTTRAELAYMRLHKALRAADEYIEMHPQWIRGEEIDNVYMWLASAVDTKACREGWVLDGQQAMAELVPYRVLYKKGRENGVKLLSDLPFVPQLEAAFTEYIDANLEMLVGYLVEI